MALTQNEEQVTWSELFKLAASFGLKPNELLDLNLGQLQAYIDGKQEEEFRQELAFVEAAYWNRVFVMSQKPPKLETVLSDLKIKRDAAIQKARRIVGGTEEQGIKKTFIEDEIKRIQELDEKFSNYVGGK